MSILVDPVSIPNAVAWWTRSATFALQISFLVGRQLMLGHEPPIHLRSMTAVRCPVLARCQLSNLPPAPLPRTRTSYRSVDIGTHPPVGDSVTEAVRDHVARIANCVDPGDRGETRPPSLRPSQAGGGGRSGEPVRSGGAACAARTPRRRVVRWRG